MTSILADKSLYKFLNAPLSYILDHGVTAEMYRRLKTLSV